MNINVKKMLIKKMLVFVALVGFGFAAGCANPLATSSDGSSVDTFVDRTVPTPNIQDFREADDMGMTVEWVVDTDFEGAIDIDYFKIKYKKATDTEYKELGVEISSDATTYSTEVKSDDSLMIFRTPFFDDGFGTYYIKMQAAGVNGNNGPVSTEESYNFTGYLDFVEIMAESIDTAENGTETIGEPVAISVDTLGHLYTGKDQVYVLDEDSDRIFRIQGGSWIETFGNEEDETMLQNMYDLGVDQSNGLLLVVDDGIATENTGRVIRFNPRDFNASQTNVWKQADISAFDISFAEAFNPQSIAVDSSGTAVVVYVSDVDNHRLLKLILNPYGESTDLAAAYESPAESGYVIKDIAVSDDKVYALVRSGSNDLVVRYSKSGFTTEALEVFLNSADSGTELGIPMGIAIDTSPAGADLIYISDYQNDKIRVFDSVGTDVATWGLYGDDDGEFACPYALDYKNGKLYVTEAGYETEYGPRLQVFEKSD